ncbi:putative phenylalanine--tRNA ligase [Helianthus anomalus]
MSKIVKISSNKYNHKVARVDDNVKALLIKINDGEALNQEDIDALKRRKLISPQIWKGYSVKKGPNYAPKRRKPATDLTRENLQSGEWMELLFKEYNFLAKGFPVEGGYLHPLLKARILFVIFDIL